MRVLILGDCHGKFDRVHDACIQAQERWGIEAAIQVGDFGFFPKVLQQFFQDQVRFPIPLHVIDGNHEDHGWLLTARETGLIEDWKQAHIHLHARATTIVLDGATIGFLGGALHADRRQEWPEQWARDGTLSGADARRPGRRVVPANPAWANWVTESDCDRALAAFTAQPPDLLVTHSCPMGIGIGMTGDPARIDDVERHVTRAGFQSGPLTDCGEPGLTRLWHHLTKRPPVWVFGHFHCLHERTIEHTRFVCVGSSDDSDGEPGIRPILFDTTTRDLEILRW